ncbi:TPA: hypothetical protein ACH3X2_004844 [Trebouxia sp. C0005]
MQCDLRTVQFCSYVYTQHSVAWRHHVMLESGFKVYHQCSCVAVLPLLLLLNKLVQIADLWKISSLARYVLDDAGACRCLEDENVGGVAACWSTSKLGFECSCRTKFD